MTTRPTAPLCQSCGLPLTHAAEHGTDLGGRIDEDYCHFCFKEGVFTQPHLSMEEMIQRLGGFAPELNMSRAQALAFAREVLPTLKRWRDQTP